LILYDFCFQNSGNFTNIEAQHTLIRLYANNLSEKFDKLDLETQKELLRPIIEAEEKKIEMMEGKMGRIFTKIMPTISSINYKLAQLKNLLRYNDINVIAKIRSAAFMKSFNRKFSINLTQKYNPTRKFYEFEIIHEEEYKIDYECPATISQYFHIHNTQFSSFLFRFIQIYSKIQEIPLLIHTGNDDFKFLLSVLICLRLGNVYKEFLELVINQIKQDFLTKNLTLDEQDQIYDEIEIYLTQQLHPKYSTFCLSYLIEFFQRN
jgi:hypothetical protein